MAIHATEHMLGLLQKHCPVCGMDVDKNTALKRFGKYFCSEEHASQYAEMKMTRDAERRDYGGGGGCC
jgi:YHS domain-containing protein